VSPPFPLLPHLPRAIATGGAGESPFQARDTLGAAAGALRDTVTPPPLPGGVATVLRVLFQVPQWIQIAGAVAGLIVAILLAGLLWRRRRAIVTWIRTRSRELQFGLVAAVLLLVLVLGLAGMKSWDYMQHENAFCTGCHIMERPFQRFATSAGKHETLACHDCHQQSLVASMRQLVLWVAERPEQIGTHARVPNARCESCHQPGRGGRERWQHVRRLAGHRVHFESDSAQLQGLTCVQCHGAEVHRFVPSNRACQPSGCHEQQPIRLSHMAAVPEMSCVTCHDFAADLPGLASRDSAVRALVPARDQCQSCHEMRAKPAGYVAARDPHRGSCGSCHNVHADRVPADARGSCRTCHADLSRSAFHEGANHRRVQARCLTCHPAHAASVDASDCVGCHQDVRRRERARPPIPFDTAAVLRSRPRSPVPPAGLEPPGGARSGPSADESEPPVEGRPPGPDPLVAPDSFPHARHRALPCLTCHLVNRPGAGLAFEVPRGCDLCHHQQVVAGRVEARDCVRCHRPEATARAMEVPVRMPNRPPAVRLVGFRHDRHDGVGCAVCHRPPEVLPPDSVRSCGACHEPHHEAARECAACHSREDTPAAHRRADHTGCDACHTPSRIAPLVPARTFCLTCHARERLHQPGRECTPCHFLQTAAEFRPHLMRTGR
jgi:hypothetical protein